jgi:hypothetical protein
MEAGLNVAIVRKTYCVPYVVVNSVEVHDVSVPDASVYSVDVRNMGVDSMGVHGADMHGVGVQKIGTHFFSSKKNYINAHLKQTPILSFICSLIILHRLKDDAFLNI